MLYYIILYYIILYYIILYYIILYERPFLCNVINQDRTEKLSTAKSDWNSLPVLCQLESREAAVINISAALSLILGLFRVLF